MATLRSVALPDGRHLDVRVSGPDDGMPLVFHHGTPGARTAFGALERAVHSRGLRLVTLSRPGYGGSTRRAGRTVVDVVEDTDAVVRTLGTDRCLVGGWSGGGPHALACAARLGAVAGALVIAGVAPADAPGLDFMAGMGEENLVEFGAARSGEARLRPYLVEAGEHLRQVTPAEIVSSLASLLPDVDRVVLTDEFGDDMAASFREAVRLGIDGWLDDDLAFVRPWGFELDEIEVPTTLCQGTADLMVPFAHGRWLASQLPGAVVHLREGEGHLSIWMDTVDVMLDELVASVG